MSERPSFTEMLDRFGRTYGPPRTPDLPTEPGLYVAKGDSDLTGVTVYKLDRNGFWWHLGELEATADEVRDHAGSRPLEPLIRHGEADQ